MLVTQPSLLLEEVRRTLGEEQGDHFLVVRFGETPMTVIKFPTFVLLNSSLLPAVLVLVRAVLKGLRGGRTVIKVGF